VPGALPEDEPDPEAELRTRLLLYRAHRDAGRVLQEIALERVGLFRREPGVAAAAGRAGARPPAEPPLDVGILVAALDRLGRIAPPPPQPRERKTWAALRPAPPTPPRAPPPESPPCPCPRRLPASRPRATAGRVRSQARRSAPAPAAAPRALSSCAMGARAPPPCSPPAPLPRPSMKHLPLRDPSLAADSSFAVHPFPFLRFLIADNPNARRLPHGHDLPTPFLVHAK